ncbi:unnamed protein product [Chrysoparadoxa australica]
MKTDEKMGKSLKEEQPTGMEVLEEIQPTGMDSLEEVQPAGMEAAEAQEEEPGEMQPQPKVKRVKKFFAKDFSGSTWELGINWNNSRKIERSKISFREDGSLGWLSGHKGSWVLNSKSRSLCFYKDFTFGWAGKRIFGTRLLDNANAVYMEGDIKGWGPWFPLEKMGQWQAIKCGVDLTEYGQAPWETREVPEGAVVVQEEL